MSLSLPVVIDGKPRRLNFRGGLPGAGYYVTSDKKEQTAIESNARYGNNITLEGVYGLADAFEESGGEVVGCEIPDEVDSVNTVEESGGEVVGCEIPDEVDSVNTVQEAREWLISHNDAKASELPNKAAVLAFASAKGVVFPNLK